MGWIYRACVLCLGGVVTDEPFSSRRVLVVYISAAVKDVIHAFTHSAQQQDLTVVVRVVPKDMVISSFMASKKKEFASENEESSASVPRCSDSESSDTEEELEEPSSTFHRRVSTNRTLKNSVSTRSGSSLFAVLIFMTNYFAFRSLSRKDGS